MNAMDRGRIGWKLAIALAASGSLGLGTSVAQALQRSGSSSPQRASARPTAASKAGKASTAKDDDLTPKPLVKRIPVNPDDPIALVNGEKITRRELADECVAQSGEKILEALINRRLIEQEVRAKRVSITASEIDAEIERVAQTMAHVDRETWLKTLAKERGISPSQYARDMIYPSLALRKLAIPGVVVTPQDIKEGFEAAYGDRIRCRMIMVNNQTAAKQVWEAVKKNPADFEKLAKARSMDEATRSLGGLMAEPITRHAEPRQISDRVFEQLVDGDPADDEAHKPKNGSFTGPIQVSKDAWVVFMREEWMPGKKVNADDPKVKALLAEQIKEVKISEKMDTIFRGIKDRAAIENRLTGQVSIAGERGNGLRDAQDQTADAGDDPTARGRKSVSTLKGNQPRVKTPPAPRLARPEPASSAPSRR